MSKELQIALLGVITIAFLELIALLKGLDGQMFSFATATIGGIIGYLIKELHHRHKG